MSDEFDAPWKVALELFLEPFLQLCFPAVHALIDWRIAPVFLEAELQQIAPENAQGPRTADRLVKVRLLEGREEWLFIHIEIQAQRERDFARRMWTYYYRIWDKFSRRVLSLAVLADDRPGWRPNVYRTEFAGCIQHFEFPVFKVLDCTAAAESFEETGNPFALLIAAHQLALRTQRNAAARYEGRFRLIRHLRRLGLEPRTVWNLLKLIAWLNRLPGDWELRFRQEWNNLPNSERVMNIDEVKSPFELGAMEEARIKAQHEAVLDVLDARFGSVTEDVRQRVLQTTDESRLRRAHRLAVTEPNLEAVLSHL